MDELQRRAQPLLDDPPVARTPVPDLRRRALRRRVRHTLAAVTALAASVTVIVVVATTAQSPTRVEVAPPTGTSTSTAATIAPGAVGAPGSFVSTRIQPGGSTVVAVSDATTGKILHTLYSVPFAWSVTGTAIGPDGDVWVTVDHGPKMLGHVAGGNPQAHTCASTVYRIDPRTGRRDIALSGGDDELITDVQPSPTGDRIAYLRSGCATYYFDSTLEVKDLHSGTVLGIGTGLARCHLANSITWTADGDRIAMVYGKANPSYPGGLGTCSQWNPGQLVVVSARAASPDITGATASADPGCEIHTVTVTGDGYAAVEHCGSTLFINGAARVVRYDANLRVVSRATLGECEDGAAIAGNRHDETVIVSTYLYCGGTPATPVTKVFRDPGTGPRTLLTIPGGETAVEYISF